MTDREAAGFGADLLKGGFAIFDDFRGDFRGGGGWDNFQANITKRLVAMVNFNTDVSNCREFSATGLRPIDEANQAYKLGVNDIIYGLTH